MPLSPLLPKLYSAPTAGWTAFLDALRLRFDARQAMLSLVDYRRHRIESILHHVGFTAEQEAEFLEKWAHQDPWAQRAPAHRPIGAVRASHELCPDEILETLPVYQQFLVRHGWHYGAGVIVLADAGLEGTLTFVRPKARGPVSPAELDLLRQLQPHVTAAAQLELRLRSLELAAGISSRLPYGVALLDRQLNVLHANAIALELLPKLPLNGAPPPASRYVPEAKCWMIARPFAGPPSGTELVLLRPSQASTADAGQLQTVFGLTPAEARLTVHLCGGRNLTETAADLGIALDTARTHLKRVLSKTHCRRQAELVSLVLKLG